MCVMVKSVSGHMPTVYSDVLLIMEWFVDF